jgi:hypothetical protein
LLHDVGKIGIDDQVLRKPGKLTPAEFEHIKTHARIGHNILVDLKQLGEVLDEGEAGLIVAYAANMADQVVANVKFANRMVSAATEMAAEDLAREIKEAENA